jgi:hypothetical protein
VRMGMTAISGASSEKQPQTVATSTLKLLSVNSPCHTCFTAHSYLAQHLSLSHLAEDAVPRCTPLDPLCPFRSPALLDAHRIHRYPSCSAFCIVITAEHCNGNGTTRRTQRLLKCKACSWGMHTPETAPLAPISSPKPYLCRIREHRPLLYGCLLIRWQ